MAFHRQLWIAFALLLLTGITSYYIRNGVRMTESNVIEIAGKKVPELSKHDKSSLEPSNTLSPELPKHDESSLEPSKNDTSTTPEIIAIKKKANQNQNHSKDPTVSATHLRTPSHTKDLITGRESIPLNLESAYVDSDIVKIVHLPAEARIHIHLEPKTKRRCQNPVFKGRISGWSLSMIDFENTLSQSENDLVVGTYDPFHMPLPGKYYIEIIVLLCERYKEGFRTSLNLKNVCLEYVLNDNGRITDMKGNAFMDAIHWSNKTKPTGKYSRGRWLHKSLLSDNREQHHKNGTDGLQLEPGPLFTPYQARNRDYKEAFQEYTYWWNSGPGEALNQPDLGIYLKKQKLQTTNTSKICFLGASHSTQLKNGCIGAMNNTKYESKLRPFSCGAVLAHFTENVTQDTMSKINQAGCTHLVVGLFQWNFSFKNLWESITFDKWKDDMIRTVEFLQMASAKNQVLIRRILLRSAHPNGLKRDAVSCPAKDWRNPINSDIGNIILQEIANGVASNNTRDDVTLPPVSFIDTTFLIDAVWDSASDWSHYSKETSQMEARFLVSEILKEDF